MNYCSNVVSLLIVSVLCVALQAQDGDASPKNEQPKNNNLAPKISFRISPDMFKDQMGKVLEADGQAANLIAKLWSGGDVIWQETQAGFQFPPEMKDKNLQMLLILGRTNLMTKDGKPISFKSGSYSLSFHFKKEKYSTDRFPIRHAAFAYEAATAFGASGELKAKLAELEQKIRVINELIAKLDGINGNRLKTIEKEIWGKTYNANDPIWKKQ